MAKIHGVVTHPRKRHPLRRAPYSKRSRRTQQTRCQVRAEFPRRLHTQRVAALSPSAVHDPSLILQMLGRDFVCPMVFLLHFNSQGKLVRHDADADIFAGVLRVLAGDFDAASRFMDVVRVGQESMVGPIVELTAEDTSERLQPPTSLQESEGFVSRKSSEKRPQPLVEADVSCNATQQRHSLAFLIAKARAALMGDIDGLATMILVLRLGPSFSLTHGRIRARRQDQVTE